MRPVVVSAVQNPPEDWLKAMPVIADPEMVAYTWEGIAAMLVRLPSR